MVRIVDKKVLVYGDIDATATPVFALTTGDEVLIEGVVNTSSRAWLKIRDNWDTVGFIDLSVGVEMITAVPEQSARQRRNEEMWWWGAETAVGGPVHS